MNDDEYTERHTQTDEDESVVGLGMLGIVHEDGILIREDRLGLFGAYFATLARAFAASQVKCVAQASSRRMSCSHMSDASAGEGSTPSKPFPRAYARKDTPVSAYSVSSHPSVTLTCQHEFPDASVMGRA